MPIERLFRLLKYKLEEFVDSELKDKTFEGGQYSGSYESQTEEELDPDAARELQYYANLELEPTNDFPKIKSQYRSLMKQYHPDRFNGNEEKIEMARKVTSKLNEAYDYFEKKLNA